jgi:hypothetical protein
VKFSSALDASATVAALWYPVLQYTPNNPPCAIIQLTTSLATSPNSSWQKTALTVQCDSTETLVLYYKETKKVRCVFDFVEAFFKATVCNNTTETCEDIGPMMSMTPLKPSTTNTAQKRDDKNIKMSSSFDPQLKPMKLKWPM